MVYPQHVSKIFRTKQGDVAALYDVSLRINEGEFVVIRGHSGSGKTTLLLALGGMLQPTSGKVEIDGQDIYALSKRERAQFRAQKLGFVFQMFYLVPYLSVLENIILPDQNSDTQITKSKAKELLERLGLSARMYHKPAQLSAGERQRAAIARAMLNRPKLILADEPTGNLDPENARQVIEGLDMFHRDGGTVIVVTHGTIADPHADHIIHLRNGQIEQAGESSN